MHRAARSVEASTGALDGDGDGRQCHEHQKHAKANHRVKAIGFKQQQTGNTAAQEREYGCQMGMKDLLEEAAIVSFKMHCV